MTEMTDDTNDKIPADSGKKLPASLDSHLRSMMQDNNLRSFRDELPEDFVADASEGLDHLKDKKQLESVLKQLNKQMRQHLTHKKIHKRRHYIGDLSWTYWAIIIIFLLTIIGFVVIRMFLHQ